MMILLWLYTIPMWGPWQYKTLDAKATLLVSQKIRTFRDYVVHYNT